MALSSEAAAALDCARAESMRWLRAQFKQETPAGLKGSLYASRSIARYPNRVLSTMLGLCRSGLTMTLTDFEHLRELLVSEVGLELPLRMFGRIGGNWGSHVVDLTDSVRSIVGAGETWDAVLEHFTTSPGKPLQSKDRIAAQPSAKQVAGKAGLSIRSVYAYRKNPSKLKPETRRAISSAIEQLSNI